MSWSQSSGALRGHEGQPLVVEVDGKPMMYLVSAWPNIVQALDLTDPDNPKEIWNYLKKTDRDESAVPRACCDTVNRGLSYAEGEVVFGTLDGFVIALDAKTGKQIWVVKHAYPEHGETQTNAPMIAENLVIAGFGGDEFAARGRLDAYDLKPASWFGARRATVPTKKSASLPKPTRITLNTALPVIASASPIRTMNGSVAAARPGLGTATIPN